MRPVAMNVVDVVGFIFSGLIVIESDTTSFVYERHPYNDVGSHLLAFSLLNASVYAPWLLSHAGATTSSVQQLPGSVNFPFCYSCLFAFPNLHWLLSKVPGWKCWVIILPTPDTLIDRQRWVEKADRSRVMSVAKPTHDDHRKHILELHSMSVMPISSRMTQFESSYSNRV